MDIKEIKTLTELMVDNDLSEIMIRDGEKRILLRRQGAGGPQALSAPQFVTSHSPATVSPSAAVAGATNPGAPATAAEAPVADAGLELIKSPMVGTFYAASDPEAPPFVEIGGRVTPDMVIAIIEAMKVFNEIKAEVTGTIESIEVHNADAVEFGQVLMKVRPE